MYLLYLNMNHILIQDKYFNIESFLKSISCLAIFCFCLVITESSAQSDGQFYRTYWFGHGIEHGNPSFNNRFRVNAPEAGLHHIYAYRSETRGNGMMQILIEEDLRSIEGAELYLEIWGGHPGTSNKRVIINGRSTYHFPEDGTTESNIAHQYPVIAIEKSDLVNGYNVLQFACDQGTAFWGHFIVENAQIRILLSKNHDDLQEADLNDFDAFVAATPSKEDEIIQLKLDIPEERKPEISSVEFLGFYQGYDENGNRKMKDWHGFTKHRKPVAHLGTATGAPFALDWDTRMLPPQKDIKVKAVVRFKDHEELLYTTKETEGLEVHQRDNTHVRLYTSQDIPKPFWSRAGNLNQATIQLDIEPTAIEEANLHVVTWDGGAGTIEEYFKLNGEFFPVAAEGLHDVIYSVLPVDPSLLKKGENRFELLSDTEHHGIEVLLPGPALTIRYKYRTQ